MVKPVLDGRERDAGIIRGLLPHPAIIAGVRRFAAVPARYDRGQRANPAPVLPGPGRPAPVAAPETTLRWPSDPVDRVHEEIPELVTRHAALPSRSARCRRSEEHTSELQSLRHLVCRLLLEKKKIEA